MVKTANPPHSTAVWAFFGAGFWLIFVLFANFVVCLIVDLGLSRT